MVALSPAQVAQLEPILQLLRGDAIEPHLEGEDLAEFEADRTTLEVQAKSSRPKRSVVAAVLPRIKDFAMQVGARGVVVAIDALIRTLF